VKYLLLIYNQEGEWQAPTSPQEMEASLKPWWDYGSWLKEKGWYLEASALQPTASATTVRVREGKTLSTDGPFAETKEQLGGFYLIDCDNLDQAIDAASRIPLAEVGSIEVRPIQEFPEGPESS
jgi:hypothetical protein